MLTGITEQQWKFLRLRSYDESDAESARALRISPRIVESWKRRPGAFAALYALALHQPQLFASGEFVWREVKREAPTTNNRHEAVESGQLPFDRLYSRDQSDVDFAKELRSRELAVNAPAHRAPEVDLRVPDQHRRLDVPPREMGPGECRLAELLGVEHCVVLGSWNGKPSLAAKTKYEKAVDVACQFTPGFRIDAWYPQVVVMTSAGLVVVADGTLAKDARCPVKSRARCPLVDLGGVDFGACSYWELALGTWLDMARPSSSTPQPICHREFALARLLTYVAAATMRGPGEGGGWSAGFPVITFRDDAERVYWRPRVERWNKLILDPWHRIHLVDRDVMIDALADVRLHQLRPSAAAELANAH